MVCNNQRFVLVSMATYCQRMPHIMFMLSLVNSLLLPTNVRSFYVLKEGDSACVRAGNLSHCSVPYIEATSDKEADNKKIHQIPERNEGDTEEFEKLKRKWQALIKAHGPEKTPYLIPPDWLLSTAHHNVALNSIKTKNAITEKLLKLIKTHQVPDNPRYKKSPTEQISKAQDKPHNVVLQTSLSDKIKRTGQRVIKKLDNNSTHQLENIESEYPSNNQTIRKKLFEQWAEYYKCLENMRFVPEAHFAFPGESIELKCPACTKPGEKTRIVWTMATLRTRHKEEDINLLQKKSTFSSNNRISIYDGGLGLQIYGVNERDAGNYTCRELNRILTVHLLQVAESVENIIRVWPEDKKGKPHASPELSLPNSGIVVFTKWKNWTSCSRCARAGKRFRVGVCTVRASDRKGPAILSLFRAGLPCHSNLLPKSIHNHPNVITRKSEIIETFCKVPCPKEKKYVVRNKNGQIIEEADNSKGVYSMLQKLPKLPPPIKRKILFFKQWDTAHIQCPGSLLNDVPAHWFINSQPIYSKGDRIYVTPSHILVIEDLGLSDSSLYSCWQGSKLVGTIRLVVSQPIRLTFSQQISAISMILIVLTIVIIFLRALCNSLRSNQ